MKKLRVWLIHKLGGKVSADIPPVKKKEIHIIDIHASANFTHSLIRNEAARENFEKYKARMLADGLAQQILEQGLATITSKPVNIERSPDELKVTAKAYLIREKDALMENCDSLILTKTIPYEEAEKQFKQRSIYGAW